MAAYISFQPSDYFTTKLYTGDASSSNAITGVGFQPDWTWIKGRNIAESHRLYDAVRGASNYVTTNSTGVQSSSIPLTSFNADGFTIGSADNSVNGSYNYASWNWKAGTTSGLSGGTITPAAYSINTTSGFGIYQRVGTATAGTIAHGLGAVPKFIIHKGLTWSSNWRCYHVDAGNDKCINLNETGAAETNTMWNDTTPTDTVYSTGSNNDGNKSGEDIIEYVFTDKKGFSSFGSYIGNGYSNGPFVYTGFRPAWLLRRILGTDYWSLIDTKRLGFNPDNSYLFPNDSAAEGAVERVDILSNGFKVRTTDTAGNTDGTTYVYAAFADFPIVSSNDIPGVAR